ncbi:MAG: hypothetical protein ACF788_03985, partial [Novipirellula sp. JB048]
MLSQQLPGDLEAVHHRLLEQQGQVEDDRELLAQAEAFVAEARGMGATLEDLQVRKRCQSMLDYWAIFIYRVDLKDVDAELLPYDPSQSLMLADAQFPYDFSMPPGDGQDQPLQGWRRLLDECERDLAQFQLLMVVSDPGSGGRTLVHNLLLPSLRSGRARRSELTGSERWRYYEVTFHDHPLRELLAAMAKQDGRDEQWVRDQQAEIRSDPKSLIGLLQKDSQLPVVLVFRRFNTLLRVSKSERLVVCRALNHLMQDSQQRFYLIATFRRSDATQLSRFGPLETRLRDGHVLLALTTAELRHLIEEPARRVGLAFEPGLIDQLLIDIQGEATAVPLLQFTLKRLWDRRERNRMTWQAYQETGAGSVAVSRAMQALYEDLTPPQQVALRHLLLAMVVMEPGGGFRTSEISRKELPQDNIQPADMDVVIQRLQQQEMLCQRQQDDQLEYVLAHHSLLTAWPPLVEWLDEMRVGQRFRLRLKESAEHWAQLGRPSDLVWRGAMLMQADEEFGDGGSLSSVERDFISAGRRRETSKRRRHWAVVGLVLLTVLSVIIAFLQHRTLQAEQVALKAEQAKLIAEQATLIAKQKSRMESKQRKSETRQRMYGNAVRAIRQVDLTGELLWLEAYDEAGDLPSIDSAGMDSEIGAEMRRLAQMQLPVLTDYFKATEWETKNDASASNGSKEPRFVDMAVQAFPEKHRFLAVLRRNFMQSEQDPSSERYQLTA